MPKPQPIQTSVGDLAAAALTIAKAERWSICVIVGGEETRLQPGRPGRKLVIELTGTTANQRNNDGNQA